MRSNGSPLRPHPNAAGHLRGRNIEQELLGSLSLARELGHLEEFLQPDALAIDKNGRPFLIECKGQDYFRAPPFDGHGLPVAQAVRYMQVYKATGLRTLLRVRDTNALWVQWLDVLERGPRFDTRGTIKTPRRIYPLTSFDRRE